jgi:hypothetical protein
MRWCGMMAAPGGQHWTRQTCMLWTPCFQQQMQQTRQQHPAAKERRRAVTRGCWQTTRPWLALLRRGSTGGTHNGCCTCCTALRNPCSSIHQTPHIAVTRICQAGRLGGSTARIPCMRHPAPATQVIPSQAFFAPGLLLIPGPSQSWTPATMPSRCMTMARC